MKTEDTGGHDNYVTGPLGKILSEALNCALNFMFGGFAVFIYFSSQGLKKYNPICKTGKLIFVCKES